jgi:hypothetical protein
LKGVAVQHDRETEKWIEQLRDADERGLQALEQSFVHKRIVWFRENSEIVQQLKGDLLERAYQLLLMKIGIDESDAPVINKTDRLLVFHSKNFCPSLEACIKLGLDPRSICKSVFEKPADILVKQLDPSLCFSRNYQSIRPYCDFCEEMISLIGFPENPSYHK